MNEPTQTPPDSNGPAPAWKWKERENPTLHDHLWNVCKTLPSDFEPYGIRKRDEVLQGENQWYPDCSCGCKFFKKLEGAEGCDWGVCWNPKSPRQGLLTFEHQGCPAFEYGPAEDSEEDPKEDPSDLSAENPPMREEDPI
jgi:hypothetical protein